MKKGIIQFVLGLVIALTGAFFMWHGSILGERTITIAIVMGIFGILLIATSKYRLMGRKKKK
jgi:hypothetical protein